MNENTTNKGEKMDGKRIAELRGQYNGIWSEHRHHHPFGSLAHSTIDIRECLDALEAALARNAALERWKSEASSVLSGIDLQAIASEIGTKLGHDIGPAILPWIKDRKAHIARLEAALAKERIVVAQITNVMEAQAAAQAGGVVVVPEPTADEWRLIAENARSADMVDFLSGAASYGLWLRGKIPTAIPASRVLGELEAQAAAQPEKETQIGSSDSGYFRRELVSLLGRLLNADGPWLARYLRRLADVAEPTPTQAAAQAGGVMSPERIGAEELAVLREVVRLVAEARERYDKRPRGADGQRMPDEIDDLLCRLYEIALHFRAQTTEWGV